MTKPKSQGKRQQDRPPQFDDVLRRMLSSPPQPKVKPKSEQEKQAK